MPRPQAPETPDLFNIGVGYRLPGIPPRPWLEAYEDLADISASAHAPGCGGLQVPETEDEDIGPAGPDAVEGVGVGAVVGPRIEVLLDLIANPRGFQKPLLWTEILQVRHEAASPGVV